MGCMGGTAGTKGCGGLSSWRSRAGFKHLFQLCLQRPLVCSLELADVGYLQCGNWQDLQIRTFSPKGQFAKHLPAHHGDTIHWTVSWEQYSLEGLMLKLKLQYFGHLMKRTDSFEKTLMLGKIEGRRRRGRQRMRWLDLIQP